MRATDENARLRAIFHHINEMLWEYAQAPFGSLAEWKDEGSVMEKRAKHIGRESERLQEVIAAYFEQQTAMMRNLMKDARFARFPLPRKRIGLRTRISIHRELWRAIRTWPFHGRGDP